MIGEYIIFCLFSYFLGSINFARIFGYFIRKEIPAEKNPGATTVFREISKPVGILTALFDILKGVLPVALALFYFADTFFSLPLFLFIIGCFAVLGHLYPIYHRFKGGRGGATTIGALLVILPYQILLVCLPIYLILSLIFKRNMIFLSLFFFPIIIVFLFAIKSHFIFYNYLSGIILMSLIILIRNFDQFKNKKIN